MNSLEESEVDRISIPERKKLLFVGIDGFVIAESSKEVSDENNSSFTRVVAVGADELWG